MRTQDTADNLAHSHEDCSWPTTFYCAACGDTEVLVLGEVCADCRRDEQAEADAAIPCVDCGGTGHFTATGTSHVTSDGCGREWEEPCECAAGLAWGAARDERRANDGPNDW